jgi:general secretion pathway protein I
MTARGMSGSRGFTLLEVLVALSILAITLAAASRSSGNSILALEESRHRLLAGWVAENRLAEHQATASWPEFGQREGREAMGNENFVWKETTASTPNVMFRRLEIVVASEQSPDHVLARLNGFLVRPGG